jgi:hypothetical protein
MADLDLHYTHYTRPQFHRHASSGECVVWYKQKTVSIVIRTAFAPVYFKQPFQYLGHNEASLVKIYSLLLF